MRVTPADFIEREGKVKGVYCVRKCVGYVGGHVRGTRGKVATFTHPTSGRTYIVSHCLNCGAYWKVEERHASRTTS